MFYERRKSSGKNLSKKSEDEILEDNESGDKENKNNSKEKPSEELEKESVSQESEGGSENKSKNEEKSKPFFHEHRETQLKPIEIPKSSLERTLFQEQSSQNLEQIIPSSTKEKQE